jgi:hypothetical protein
VFDPFRISLGLLFRSPTRGHCKRLRNSVEKNDKYGNKTNGYLVIIAFSMFVNKRPFSPFSFLIRDGPCVVYQRLFVMNIG